MRLPIDTGTVKFAAASPAEPVLDYETRAPKLDENGTPLYPVPLFAAGGGIKDSITVKVAGDVMGLSEFTVVNVTNLIATSTRWAPWSVVLADHNYALRALRGGIVVDAIDRMDLRTPKVTGGQLKILKKAKIELLAEK